MASTPPSTGHTQESGQRRVPQVLVAVHPSNQETFKKIAVSKKELKVAKSNILSMCYHCKRPEEKTKLFKCAKCLITLYCSREVSPAQISDPTLKCMHYKCQKANWKAHKPECRPPTAMTQKLSSFVNSLVANEVVQANLAIAFACELKMKEDFDASIPLQGQCDLVLEPSDIAFDTRLLVGEISPSATTEVECMVQLKNFTVYDTSAWFEPTRAKIWKDMMEQLMTKVPIAVVSFHMEGLIQSVTSGVVIPRQLIQLANSGGGFAYQSALNVKCRNVKHTIFWPVMHTIYKHPHTR